MVRNKRSLPEPTEKKMNYNPAQNGVRLILCGDSGVGKTSLIYSLVHDEFRYDLPAKLNDTIIPAEITPDRVPIYITDFSDRDGSAKELGLKDAINKADVVCIVYIAGDRHSLMRAAQYWIPTIRGFDEIRGCYKPIILVANKVDLVPDSSLSEGIASIQRIFMNVEASIEVSALTQHNVVKLFSLAQKAHIYPLGPLVDPTTRTLSARCREALIDIFHLCDIDSDGLLNDREMNLFQESYFGIPLQADSLRELKQIIEQSISEGIRNNAVTMSGFLFIHQLSIDKGRRDFTWEVLRKYNYDNSIENIVLEDSSSPKAAITDESTKIIPITTSNDDSNHTSSSEVVTDPSFGEIEISGNIRDKSLVRRRNESKLAIVEAANLPRLFRNDALFKAGVGITMITFISFIAFKYLKTTR